MQTKSHYEGNFPVENFHSLGYTANQRQHGDPAGIALRSNIEDFKEAEVLVTTTTSSY